MNKLHAFAAAALVAVATCPAFADNPKPPAPAQAPATATAEILVMHATQAPGEGSIDPRIGDLPQLKKPPFSAYNTYKLLDSKKLPLKKGEPGEYALVNGRTLQVLLRDISADKRYSVHTAINQPGGATFLKLLDVTAAPNEPFFVGGQSYQGGSLVLAITMRP
jgi:hypothetical protein